MDLKTRQAFIRQLSPVYRKAAKKERGRILDQVVISTGNYDTCNQTLTLNGPTGLETFQK